MLMLLSRSLGLALHFVLLGGLADVALQLHHGQAYEAVAHAGIAALCILILAWAGQMAKRISGENN